MQVECYTAAAEDEWNDFVRSSRNGTFLFHRDYMEYHRDRFQDHSLLIRDQKGTLSALLPANRNGSTLESHGGLTYGGLVVGDRIKTVQMLQALDAILKHLATSGLHRIVYRAVPHIYHRRPAEEDLYALHRRGAKVVDRNVLSVVAPAARVPLQSRRKRSLKKAEKAGLRVSESSELESYWSLLTEVLRTTYDSRPVHSLEEIERLQARFPGNIRLFSCHREDTLLAGVLVYEDAMVARSQYIASSGPGKRHNALDLVFQLLLETIYSTKPFFDFGSSAGDSEHGLNVGVLGYKESWGARAVVQDTYELAVPHH